MSSANHLAVAVGEMAGDFNTFTNANHQDSNGNKYAVMSSVVTDLFFQYAGSQLQRRDFAPEEWSAELAAQAQAAVEIWFGPTEEYPEPPQASSNKIVGIIHHDPYYAVNAAGLTQIPEGIQE